MNDTGAGGRCAGRLIDDVLMSRLPGRARAQGLSLVGDGGLAAGWELAGCVAGTDVALQDYWPPVTYRVVIWRA
jgi:hypothetical protein